MKKISRKITPLEELAKKADSVWEGEYCDVQTKKIYKFQSIMKETMATVVLREKNIGEKKYFPLDYWLNSFQRV